MISLNQTKEKQIKFKILMNIQKTWFKNNIKIKLISVNRIMSMRTNKIYRISHLTKINLKKLP